ncbi:uncharacterized protein PRCAT00002013001 [Priceomyces carsonii]|uniref:uncharacterized protein n=1 Tax=Priceomyces carsonii TaxID=28549 RepID=UPI002EDBA22D|nr:unnamed protein product [Priceomyces carsonii]
MEVETLSNCNIGMIGTGPPGANGDMTSEVQDRLTNEGLSSAPSTDLKEDMLLLKERERKFSSVGAQKPQGSNKKTDMKILADGKVMKVQRARQRKILSCVYCHSKKIKCSRVRPMCNNCDKLGIDCKYFINERVSRGGKKSSKLEGSDEKEEISDMKRGSTSSGSPGLSFDHGNGSSDSDNMDKSPMSQLTTSASEVSELTKASTVPELSLNYLNLNLEGFPHNYSSKSTNSNGYSNNNQSSGISNSVLQTPILNNTTNNMSNKFFNVANSNASQPAGAVNAEEQLSFNLNSFNFPNNNNSVINSPEQQSSNHQLNVASLFAKSPNYIENSHVPPTNRSGDTNAHNESSPLTQSKAPSNPGLHSSLNAYSSNPATTTNYLYGTNTYYDNENLLDDLLKHIPSKERSYELLNRYINSVHILLPIMINLFDFIKIHDKYWELASNNFNSSETASNSSSNGSPSGDSPDFDLLQFYTLYFPLLYASTISEFEEYDNLLLNQDINKYLKSFNMICQYYNYPHGLKTIPLLLGNVIIQSTSPNPSTMEMSQIIRYAKFLQLHKDPIITLRINDWEVVKFRRLLWWIIFGLDALSSHNFCLPPVCRFDDFNVLMPDEEEPVFNENGVVVDKKLNAAVLSLCIKFRYDRILSELVYELHNGLSANITKSKKEEIKQMILDLFGDTNKAMNKMTAFYKANPPATVHEMNVVNFIKNHSWSFVDRALMLLHKKILLTDNNKNEQRYEFNLIENRGGALSFSKFEDTFGRCPEANIVVNFNNSSIAQLKFNQFGTFSYDNLHNNLIPSILHNLNDFLKYNDFIKYGKFNWYIKRTIPIDSIILLFIIICVKFKYEFMSLNELVIYVNLINKGLYILNRKWFKNEKYKRMLSLTNLTWEYILKKYNVVSLISSYNGSIESKNKPEFFDYQVTGYMNMSELFSIMNVPQPVFQDNRKIEFKTSRSSSDVLQKPKDGPSAAELEKSSFFPNTMIQSYASDSTDSTSELSQLNEKIYYDLRNNFVDINDYCAFYSSLENILHELMDYIHKD